MEFNWYIRIAVSSFHYCVASCCFPRWPSTCSKGCSSNTCLHFTISEATHNDWQWRKGRWAAKYFELSDDDTWRREPPRRPADVNLADVRTSQLNGACIRREAWHAFNLQADGGRESTDPSTSAQINGFLLITKHTQVGWYNYLVAGDRLNSDWQRP